MNACLEDFFTHLEFTFSSTYGKIFLCVTFVYPIQMEAHSSVSRHVLYDLEDVKRSSSTEPTLLLIDTTG